MSEKFQQTQMDFFHSFTPERAQCEGLSLKLLIIKIFSALKRDRDCSIEKGIAILNSARMKTVWDLPLNFNLTLLPHLCSIFQSQSTGPKKRLLLLPCLFSSFAGGFPEFTEWGVGKKVCSGLSGGNSRPKKFPKILPLS